MPGQMDVLHGVVMNPVQEVGIEQFPHEVQGIPLYVDEGKKKPDNVFGGKLGKLHFEIVL